MALNGKLYTTVNVDASFNHNGYAGVGAYIIADARDGRVIRLHSSAVVHVANSTNAEYCAMVYGLGIVHEQQLYSVDNIIVNLDNEHVLNCAIRGDYTHPELREFQEMLKFFLGRFNAAGADVKFRKVKAHTNNRNNNPREYINNVVDALAKEKMRSYGSQRSSFPSRDFEAARAKDYSGADVARSNKHANKRDVRKYSRVKPRFLAGPGDWEFS